ISQHCENAINILQQQYNAKSVKENEHPISLVSKNTKRHSYKKCKKCNRKKVPYDKNSDQCRNCYGASLRVLSGNKLIDDFIELTQTSHGKKGEIKFPENIDVKSSPTKINEQAIYSSRLLNPLISEALTIRSMKLNFNGYATIKRYTYNKPFMKWSPSFTQSHENQSNNKFSKEWSEDFTHDYENQINNNLFTECTVDFTQNLSNINLLNIYNNPSANWSVDLTQDCEDQANHRMEHMLYSQSINNAGITQHYEETINNLQQNIMPNQLKRMKIQLHLFLGIQKGNAKN
ncbi:8379_t:CDS:2, partial [Gigaspora margarita]